jgi:hypothetical protein
MTDKKQHVLLSPYGWLRHQGYNKEDGYYQLNREDKVQIFQFRTGHMRIVDVRQAKDRHY